ncbi:MAG: hypothetical protein HXX12_05825 [Geothrix sp.]|uniref:DUF6602 domain-containing protein n=1 Tax=Geothrix sp. TaxID=1962974 RepID=UPI0017A45281|nr:DUF6602 domain-containing protein [Geothrix sp.]NWJ40471.1 hypothetical protein [Geothrix sp.]WIL21522.1 MAG: hypothetical protein QOZ81_000786 [Geothrix sp.]
MNQAKAASKIDGKKFLREAFAAEQAVLALQLDLSSRSITHSGVMGDVNEQHFIDVLRKYLPMRYEVSQGIVIDSNGSTSEQIDIVIFDNQYTPTLLDQKSHRFIPAEAVYCVLEVKPTLSKPYLDYAAAKAHSVRILERTSVAIPHAGGVYSPKELFPIIAGIVSTKVDWTDGLIGRPFTENLAALGDTHTLNCGLAVSDRAFDTFTGDLTISEPQGSLAFFIFRLIQRLQALGTVPAVDWNKYASFLGNDF